MNARDGMRRLRAERRAYGLCIMCGNKLEDGTRFLRCAYCREQLRAYERKRRMINTDETEGKMND